jgi:hypothetical protein
MVGCRQIKVDYTYYSSSTSKSFSYLVPYTVQATLTNLLAKLLSAARLLYREYYGGIMASQARAQESADAMVVFVNESFPGVSKLHKTLANRMKLGINKQRTNILVKIPLAVDGTVAEGDEKDDLVATLWKRK